MSGARALNRVLRLRDALKRENYPIDGISLDVPRSEWNELREFVLVLSRTEEFWPLLDEPGASIRLMGIRCVLVEDGRAAGR